MMLVVYFGILSYANAQKNPNRLVKKSIRFIEKGKVSDSIQTLTKIVNVLSAPKLKKKFLKSATKTL